MELFFQASNIFWKYSAAISGQYHNVTVNCNIMLQSDHHLENSTPGYEKRPRGL